MNGLSWISCWLRKLGFLVLFFLVFRASGQYTNGIYAEFNTSMGSFTCRLDYAIAPKAVANFVGLATGARAWLDIPSGFVKTNPFYDGTTFHRVIAGFMSQGGSRNALGTDGPGYQFLDEFTNTARFDGFGVLAMANSGPDSNGSQYFITVSPQSQLNDVHTIFGRLYGGSNVVYAINHVATTNDKPLTNVMVQSVVIRRVGTNANSFDINTQGLPVVKNLNLSILKTGTNMSLSFSNRLDVENRFYSSTNLLNWSGSSMGFETSFPVANAVGINAVLPNQFFRGVQVQYPPSLWVPRNVLSRSVTFNFTGGAVISVAFDGFGGAFYADNSGHSGPAAYAWKQDAYRGRLLPLVLSGYSYVFELHLDFDGTNSGTFRGTAYLSYPSIPAGSVAGAFSSTP